MSKKSRADIGRIVLETVTACIPIKHVQLLAVVGSAGRDQHTEHSDVDILLIMKKRATTVNWNTLAKVLQTSLCLFVDLVVMSFQDKLLAFSDDDTLFYENAAKDAFLLMGKNVSDIWFSERRFTFFHHKKNSEQSRT